MSEYKYEPIVISGPSGSGKSKFIEEIEKINPIYQEAIGCTTRERRASDDGKIIILTKEEFEQLIAEKNLIEYCIYNGNYYGVSKEEFKKLDDYRVIFNVGYSSAEVIKKMYEETPTIYLMPPTKEELLKRLGDRGIERYKLGIEETMNNAMKYEFLIISETNNYEKTYEDFIDIVETKSKPRQRKLIMAHNKDFIRNFYK